MDRSGKKVKKNPTASLKRYRRWRRSNSLSLSLIKTELLVPKGKLWLVQRKAATLCGKQNILDMGRVQQLIWTGPAHDSPEYLEMQTTFQASSQNERQHWLGAGNAPSSSSNSLAAAPSCHILCFPQHAKPLVEHSTELSVPADRCPASVSAAPAFLCKHWEPFQEITSRIFMLSSSATSDWPTWAALSTEQAAVMKTFQREKHNHAYSSTETLKH